MIKKHLRQVNGNREAIMNPVIKMLSEVLESIREVMI